MEIYLRALEPNDYQLIYKWRTDSEVTSMLGGSSYFASREKEKRWVEEKINSSIDQLYLAICLRESDEMIGYTSINNIDFRNRKAEWGGTIIGDKQYWGRGIAKSAAILMLSYIFEELGLNRCYAYCLEEHEVTIRLFKSLHFTQEGVLRCDVFKKNRFHNCALFSLLKSEYDDLVRHGQ
jgi:RimJ/RimL family protein N-acetyltransferase